MTDADIVKNYLTAVRHQPEHGDPSIKIALLLLNRCRTTDGRRTCLVGETPTVRTSFRWTTKAQRVNPIY